MHTEATENGNGFNVQEFCQEWICTSGLNTISISVDLNEDGSVKEFLLTQGITNDLFPTLRKFKVNLKVF